MKTVRTQPGPPGQDLLSGVGGAGAGGVGSAGDEGVAPGGAGAFLGVSGAAGLSGSTPSPATRSSSGVAAHAATNKNVTAPSMRRSRIRPPRRTTAASRPGERSHDF